MNKFYAHFMGETGPTKLHEMEKKRITLLLEYYNQKYNRTKYASCVHFILLRGLFIFSLRACRSLSGGFSISSTKNWRPRPN